MKKIIAVVFCLTGFMVLSGCTTLKIGADIGKAQTDSMKISGESMTASAENFKEYWPVSSGFIQGIYLPYPNQDMPPRIKAILESLDEISKRATADTWDGCDKGQAIGGLVRLQVEAVKYIADERGLTVFNYIKSVAGLWGL